MFGEKAFLQLIELFGRFAGKESETAAELWRTFTKILATLHSALDLKAGCRSRRSETQVFDLKYEALDSLPDENTIAMWRPRKI